MVDKQFLYAHACGHAPAVSSLLQKKGKAVVFGWSACGNLFAKDIARHFAPLETRERMGIFTIIRQGSTPSAYSLNEMYEFDQHQMVSWNETSCFVVARYREKKVSSLQYPYLKYFIVVAELMSVSKAAQKIHISQQGLSSYLRRLESYYQVELFARKPELVLTPAGQLLLERAKTIDHAFDQLDEAFQVNHGTETTVDIGIVNSAFRYVTEKQPLIQFRDLYPDVLVRLEDSAPLEIVQDVLSNQIHFGCTNVLQEHEQLSYEYLFSQEFVLAVSDDILRQKLGDEYPACMERFQRGVDLREFAPIPYLGYPAGFVISRLLAEYREREGVSLITRLENPTSEANMQMVMFGKGFTFLVKDRFPDFQKEAETIGRPFHSFPIVFPDLKVPYYLVSKTDRRQRNHTLALMELMRESLSQQSADSDARTKLLNGEED